MQAEVYFFALPLEMAVITMSTFTSTKEVFCLGLSLAGQGQATFPSGVYLSQTEHLLHIRVVQNAKK